MAISAEEGRQQLVDSQSAAHRGDEELPHKDHHTAHHKAGQNALAVTPLPEQGAQNGGTEGGAETGPREGDDGKDAAVGGQRPGRPQ